MGFKSTKIFLNSLLILTFSCSLAFCQSTSSPISFTKTEVAVLPWGTGEKEIKLIKKESENVIHGMDQGGKITTYRWPRDMKIDGDDNVYLAGWNDQIIIVSANGKLIKTINIKKAGGFRAVDETGNVYGLYYKTGEPYGFILTKPDGTHNVYKNFNISYEENGVVYDRKNNKAVTINDNGDKPERLPPHLMSWPGEVDFGKTSDSTFIIDTKKINKHLQKVNQHINADKIQIKIEEKKNLRLFADFVGISDSGDSYFLCGYSFGPGIYEAWKEAYVIVYSRSGEAINEISVDLDSFDKQTSETEFKIDIHGNLFQMLASEDGIHILKWTKN